MKFQKGSFKISGLSIGPLALVDQKQRRFEWTPALDPELDVGDALVVADFAWFSDLKGNTALPVDRPAPDTNSAPKADCTEMSYSDDPVGHKYCCRPHEDSEAEWSDTLAERRARGELNPEVWPPVVDADAFEVAPDGCPDGRPRRRARRAGPGRRHHGRPGLTHDDHLHSAARAGPAGRPPRPRRSRNAAVAEEAIGQLRDALSGSTDIERILLKAAAGAGKSYVLKKLVADAIEHPTCLRVGVIAFQNRQLWPLAASARQDARQGQRLPLLGEGRATTTSRTTCHEQRRGRHHHVGDPRRLRRDHRHVPQARRDGGAQAAPRPVRRRRQRRGAVRRAVRRRGVAAAAPPVRQGRATLAPIVVGVGDVGQLPPLEIGTNPWRGDPGYNPYRAWPTDYDDDDPQTWSAELPAVWRPTAEQLAVVASVLPRVGRAQLRRRTRRPRHRARASSSAAPRTVWAAGRHRRPDAARGRRTARTPRPPTSTCRWSSSSSTCSTNCSPPGSRSSSARVRRRRLADRR